MILQSASRSRCTKKFAVDSTSSFIFRIRIGFRIQQQQCCLDQPLLSNDVCISTLSLNTWQLVHWVMVAAHLFYIFYIMNIAPKLRAFQPSDETLPKLQFPTKKKDVHVRLLPSSAPAQTQHPSVHCLNCWCIVESTSRMALVYIFGVVHTIAKH